MKTLLIYKKIEVLAMIYNDLGDSYGTYRFIDLPYQSA